MLAQSEDGSVILRTVTLVTHYVAADQSWQRHKKAIDNVDALILNDHYITTSDLCTILGTGKLAFMVIIRGLICSEVCVRQVLKMLIVEHKTA
jgi:hypothetical protein